MMRSGPLSIALSPVRLGRRSPSAWLPYLWLLCGAASTAEAQTITIQAETLGSSTVQRITWSGRSGTPRSVAVAEGNHRIIEQTYVIDGEEVVERMVGEYGIGNLVNHGGCEAGAVSSREAREYSAEVVFEGANHLIFRSEFRMPMCNESGESWRVTNDYLFVTSDDHFIQTVTYDSSDAPEEIVGEDMRGPYNQTDWVADEFLSGFGFGGEYKFVTNSPIGEGDAWTGEGIAVEWDWTEENMIPYVWEWVDPASASRDRETGIVQNQAYAEQDFGGAFFDCGVDCWQTAPPLSGSALPAAWAIPAQFSSYDSNYRSGRITWGSPYGTFQNGHSNDTGTRPDMGNHFYPVSAWSFTHVTGKYTDRGVLARVTDTESIYSSKLSATVGEVIVEGPRGTGDFVGPEVGTMPKVSYSQPGYDYVYRTWNVRAADEQAEVTLDVSNRLEHPTFVIHGMSAVEAKVSLDGVLLSEMQAHLSHDSATSQLWVTLAGALGSGPHILQLGEASFVEGAADPDTSAPFANEPSPGPSEPSATEPDASEPAPNNAEPAPNNAEPTTPSAEPNAPSSEPGSEPETQDAAGTDGSRNDAESTRIGRDAGTPVGVEGDISGCGCHVSARNDSAKRWGMLLSMVMLLGLRRRRSVGRPS